MLPPGLIDRLNDLLVELEYPPITASWNAEPRAGGVASKEDGLELERLMLCIQPGPWDFAIDNVAIVADDDIDLRWIVDPHSGIARRGDGDVDIVIMGEAADLARFIRGEENIGVLIRSGRIRHVVGDADIPLPSGVHRVMAALVARFASSRVEQAADSAMATVLP